ncbi:MAG TPA: glycosyltransferase family 4 protein [Candidatus Ozemobacteraceae bacterium]|nr:glycosyltransferase family 4 protein [Candidatus Ozemobacteraceae bacterium]
MRILHSLEGHTWSGGQQQALLLAMGQAARGHDVLLMCQRGSELERRASSHGVRLRPHDYRGELNPVSIAGLANAFREFRPDVVNVHRAWAHTQWALVALVHRFRGLIVTRRVLFRPDFNPVSLVKYRTPAVRGYIAVSRAVADRLKEIGVEERRIRVVYSATDTNRFSPASREPLSGPWPVPEHAPVGLLVGNYHRNKGHDLLLGAFPKAAEGWPALHLVIAGNGTDSGPLPAKLEGHPLRERIHILGYRNDVPALISRSTFTVNASYEEGFSGTVRESLSMGVPVLASDIPANREMNELVPISLFESGNEADLARGILSMNVRERPEERLRRREAAVDFFSRDSMVDATLRAYRDLGIPAS